MHNNYSPRLCALSIAIILASAISGRAQNQQAVASETFINSIGINTHFAYYLDSNVPWYSGNFPQLTTALTGLGIKNIREGLNVGYATNPSSPYTVELQLLANDGIKADMITSSEAGTVPAQVSAIQALNSGSVPIVSSVEGPNESNADTNFIYDGEIFPAGTLAFQTDLYNDMVANPATANLPVIAPSVSSYGQPWVNGAMYPYCDYGCFHPYSYGGNPFMSKYLYDTITQYYNASQCPSNNTDSTQGDAWTFTDFQPPFNEYNAAGAVIATRPMAATERGWYTGTAQSSVSQATLAKYIPRLFAEDFYDGIPLTYSYELMDEGTDVTNTQDNYGLLYNNFTPKPAYTALKNMISLISDPSGSSYVAGGLNYSIQVTPPLNYRANIALHSLLLEQSSGKYQLLLWNDISSSSLTDTSGNTLTSTARDISPPAFPTTIAFTTPIASASINNIDSSGNVETTTGTFVSNALTVNVPDNLVIVNLTITQSAPSGLIATPSNGNITLSWTANGANSYNVLRATTSGGPYTSIATVNSPTYTDASVANGTAYYYVVNAVFNGTQTANSSQVIGSSNASLLSPWQTLDIGNVGIAGSASYSGGIYTLTGSGLDIWSTNDAFRFVFRNTTGDCNTIARVTGLTNTNADAKAGVMNRDSSALGAIFAMVDVEPAGGLEFISRSATGGISTLNGSVATGITPSTTTPIWVMLSKSGSTYTAYYATTVTAPTAANWIQLGSPVTVNLTNSTYLAGLVDCSHTNTELATATLDNVSVTPLPNPWQSSDVGAVGVAGYGSSSNGVFSVTGSGGNIWGTADTFHYVDQPVTGNCVAIARLTGLPDISPSPTSKGGLMFRDSTAAGAMYALVDSNPAGGLEFTYRTATGGNASVSGTGTTTIVPSPTTPIWVELVRSGTSYTAFYSTSVTLPTSWTQIGAAETISFSNSTNLVGLAECSTVATSLNTATFDNVSVAALPSPWVSQDVGAVGVVGSGTAANGIYNLTGSGANVWGTADSFHYVDQSVTGNYTTIARVTGLTNTSASAKAGVMFRDSTAAGAMYVMVDVKPAGGLEFTYRSATGGSAALEATVATSLTLSTTTPMWVELVRSGTSYTAYYSTSVTTPTTWTQIGSAVTVSFSNSTNLTGLVDCSCSNSVLAAATFDNVSLTP